MFKYGNLRYIEEKGWVFIGQEDIEELKGKGVVEVLNILGKNGWELITIDDVVGYLFKKELNTIE